MARMVARWQPEKTNSVSSFPDVPKGRDGDGWSCNFFRSVVRELWLVMLMSWFFLYLRLSWSSSPNTWIIRASPTLQVYLPSSWHIRTKMSWRRYGIKLGACRMAAVQGECALMWEDEITIISSLRWAYALLNQLNFSLQSDVCDSLDTQVND
jgi:hypothetical protein